MVKKKKELYTLKEVQENIGGAVGGLVGGITGTMAGLNTAVGTIGGFIAGKKITKGIIQRKKK